MKIMVESMEMALGAIPRPDRVPKQTSVPRTRVGDGGRDGTFRGLMLIDLGFSRDGE